MNLEEWSRYLWNTNAAFRQKVIPLRKKAKKVSDAKAAHQLQIEVAVIKTFAKRVTREAVASYKKRPRGATAEVTRLDSALATSRDMPDYTDDDFQLGAKRGTWNEPYATHAQLDGELHVYHLYRPTPSPTGRQDPAESRWTTLPVPREEAYLFTTVEALVARARSNFALKPLPCLVGVECASRDLMEAKLDALELDEDELDYQELAHAIKEF